MSKVRLTGSNSGYVEIAAAADAGNLTFTMPTSGTALLGNTGNVFSGITTTGQLDINGSIDVSSTSVFNDDVTLTGGSYNVVWDKSDNQLEFEDNAKLSFGASSDLQLFHNGTNSFIKSNTGYLNINANLLYLGNLANNETYILAQQNNAVQLFFDNSKKIETTNTGATVTGTVTATSFSGSGEGLTRTTQFSHRNIVINGDFKIAQRGTSHGSSGYRTVDRFKMTAGGASHALTQAQVDVASGTTPYTEGFRKAYSITNAGQNANNQAYTYMQYKIEAQDLATSGWNYTSSSSFITISFWIKASVTQTYLFFLHTNDGGTKEYNHLMSLSANTWTKITLNVPGNSGLQFDNDNGLGLNIYWTAYLGDHYTSTGSVDQWVTHAGYTSRPDMGSTWWTTSNATFQLTGVQLEVGEQATPFEHRSFGEELARCQRYYYLHCNGGKGVTEAACQYDGSLVFLSTPFPVEMRIAPNLSYTNSSGYWIRYPGGSTFSTIGRDGITSPTIGCMNISISGSAGDCCMIRGNNASSKLAWEAEL